VAANLIGALFLFAERMEARITAFEFGQAARIVRDTPVFCLRLAIWFNKFSVLGLLDISVIGVLNYKFFHDPKIKKVI
jgi:hypothetical protein